MTKNPRRDFLKKAGLAVTGGILLNAVKASPVFSLAKLFEEGEYKHIPLPYPYDALEPFIDKRTMEFHHGKHHAAYVNNLNKALEEKKIKGVEFEKLLGEISKYSSSVRNNAGGHYNHTLFWSLMRKPVPDKHNLPSGKLATAINRAFGSFEEMKRQFSEKAKTVFGSGWCWLIINKEKMPEIGTTPNQDNPMMDLCPLKGDPILCLDVWEHAYYLKYMNVRADYINAWWNVVNWAEAERMYNSVK